jgi:hypothetical protein
MNQDDYEQLRSLYADIDGLCRDIESAERPEAAYSSLRQLVRLFHDQQRAPEQIASFVRHLGVSDDLVHKVLGDDPPDTGEEDGPNLL